MADTLLIEIGTEELPPCHLAKLSQAFAQKIAQHFSELGIIFDRVEDFVTPRRIAARFYNVPKNQPSRLIHRRGPALSGAYDANGNPTQAALGFARSCGVPVNELKVDETSQGSWLRYEQQQQGKSLVELLPAIIENALMHLPANKRMRWANSTVEFLRPIHWICAVHGTQVLPIKVFALTATAMTWGHRLHAKPIVIDNADNYVEHLRAVNVIVDAKERQALILQGIHQLAHENGGTAVIQEDLLDQVTGLVEWPVPLCAHFNKVFLEIPPEVLISSMYHHQKCFAIKDASQQLLPVFILISNSPSPFTANIIHGNERVMDARLSDAQFFYEQDRKFALATRLEGLKSMIFQKKLGTLYDKSQRIAKLAAFIAKQIGAPAFFTERAGKLSKADLLTEMVFEFPELQGIMGSYYARHDGEGEEVALAIKESYLPRFAKDNLPDSPSGICVALADRLDTLIGIFGMGQIPTGDKDPFALRRQALSILRILIEKALPLDLEALCQMARHGYGNLIDEEVIAHVLTFCYERFKAYYHEQGISVQTLEAVIATNPTQPFDFSRRVLAVNHFQTLPQAQHLASANKRVRNILQKNGIMLLQQLPEIDASLLQDNAEKKLAQAIEQLKAQTAPLIYQGEYQAALIELASLQSDVDAFFTEVMVMVEDEKLRNNRLHLLTHLLALFMQIADISKLAL